MVAVAWTASIMASRGRKIASIRGTFLVHFAALQGCEGFTGWGLGIWGSGFGGGLGVRGSCCGLMVWGSCRLSRFRVEDIGVARVFVGGGARKFKSSGLCI